MRKSRIRQWIISLIIAGLLFMGKDWFEKISIPKEPLYVYAPKKMETAFSSALRETELKEEYKIVMTDDLSVASVVVETGKEFLPEYTKIAYSPFVIAYSNNNKFTKDMVKKGTLQNALFNEMYQEIKFNKVVEEVIGDGELENLGVKGVGKIKVYYPAPDTEYYFDYYDFMLVTVNEGSYPKDESELKAAMEKIELFEKSEYTEAVTDFQEKFTRTGGFMENTFYLVPEVLAKNLAYNNGKHVKLFYPTTTVYVNYYLKAVDELGGKLADVINRLEKNFHNHLNDVEYRNSSFYGLGINERDYVVDERDAYNVLHLKKDRIRPEELEGVVYE